MALPERTARNPSTIEGAAYFEPVLWPWPAPSPTIIHVQEIEGGQFYLSADTEGRFIVQIVNGNGEVVHDVESCIVEMEERAFLKMALGWDQRGVTIRLNGQWIMSSDGDHQIPERALIRSLKLPDPKDLTRENWDAIKRRRDKLAGNANRPGKIRRSDTAIVEALRETTQQIRDTIRFIDMGRPDYIDPLLSLLRKVVVTGDPLPHLQLVAAMSDWPLIVYGHPEPDPPSIEALRKLSSFDMILNSCFATPEELHTNPIDIDIWLDSYGADFGAGKRTNRDIIRKLGDTRGSHFDPYIDPIETLFLSAASDLGGNRKNYLLRYLIQVANTVVEVSEQLLAAL